MVSLNTGCLKTNGKTLGFEDKTKLTPIILIDGRCFFVPKTSLFLNYLLNTLYILV